MKVKRKTPELECILVDLTYPGYDELHDLIPKRWFYGGIFYDKSHEMVDIVENHDVIIFEQDGSFTLCKHKDFDKLYEWVINWDEDHEGA